MSEFAYHRPATMAEALKILGELGAEGTPVAGATDVWVNLRLKKISPKAIVSLRSIPEMKALAAEASGLTLGAGVTHAAIEDSEWIGRTFPALRQACGAVGSRQVRNVATIGGNLCNAAPSADSSVPLFLYDAVLTLKSDAGERKVAPADFFVGPSKTCLKPGEILASIHMPAASGKTFSGYVKHTRRKAMELPLLGVGARVSLGADGSTVAEARIALCVAGPVPGRVAKAEEALVGRKLTEAAVREAAKIAAEEARVRDSWRARAWYRREMIEVLIPRVLAEAGAFA